METNKEYYVTFPVPNQITEDKWVVKNPSLKINSNTTMAEIEAFFRKHNKVEFLELKIVELL